MYRTNYNIPGPVYTTTNNSTMTTSDGYYDERGFWIPFVVGGNI